MEIHGIFFKYAKSSDGSFDELYIVITQFLATMTQTAVTSQLLSKRDKF